MTPATSSLREPMMSCARTCDPAKEVARHPRIMLVFIAPAVHLPRLGSAGHGGTTSSRPWPKRARRPGWQIHSFCLMRNANPNRQDVVGFKKGTVLQNLPVAGGVAQELKHGKDESHAITH